MVSNQLRVFMKQLEQVPPRADGNYNARDLMWALSEAVDEINDQLMEEESERG